MKTRSKKVYKMTGRKAERGNTPKLGIGSVMKRLHISVLRNAEQLTWQGLWDTLYYLWQGCFPDWEFYLALCYIGSVAKQTGHMLHLNSTVQYITFRTVQYCSIRYLYIKLAEGTRMFANIMFLQSISFSQ